MASAEVANIQTQAPHHFYREHQGLDSISRTFQSSELFTPFLVAQRPTVSGIQYKHYRDELEKSPRVPWGMHREYGGEGPINLPADHRPKSEPPTEVQKGHRHFGSGILPYPRGLPVNQYYDVTKLKKSNLRSNDELIPRPTQVDMSKLQINGEFPAEHPYSSHMSRFAVFPDFVSSRGDHSSRTGDDQRPLHPQASANPYPITVVRQSKGCSDRWERQELPLDTEKKPLKWPGDTFFQKRKTPASGQQQFYPIPPKAVLPNHPARSLDSALNPRTANALQNIERSQWQTTYNKNFTGYGPANSLRLDNFDEKVEREQRTGIEDHGLHSRSHNTFMPPRPLKGRISRLIGPNQMVRCVIKDGRIQHVPYVPKIGKESSIHPSETHESFRRPAKMAEQKKMQECAKSLETQQLEKLQQQQMEAQSLTLSGDTRKEAYDDAKVPKNYLEEMSEKHTQDLKNLTEKARWKEAELREHHHDLTLLKRKVDYTSPKIQPPVYYDSLHKIYTSKAPFYYDGDNPYEHDYVNPWDYHKTKTVLEDYGREAGVELDVGQMEQRKVSSEEGTRKEDYQFDGSPGPSPFVTQKQEVGLRSVANGPNAQDPTPHSAYTYSYSPDKVRSVDQPIDMSRLPSSSPSNLGDSGYATNSSSSGIPDATKMKHPAEANYDVSSSNPNSTSGSSKPLYDPAYHNPHSNPVVTSRHINLGGSIDTRADWSSRDPCAIRPQTSLLNMQDSFTKSDARKKFHVTFAETTPDLRENISTGKQHDFQGENLYYWR